MLLAHPRESTIITLSCAICTSVKRLTLRIVSAFYSSSPLHRCAPEDATLDLLAHVGALPIQRHAASPARSCGIAVAAALARLHVGIHHYRGGRQRMSRRSAGGCVKGGTELRGSGGCVVAWNDFSTRRAGDQDCALSRRWFCRPMRSTSTVHTEIIMITKDALSRRPF